METYVLGSAVSITAVLEDDLTSGGTVTITIYDSCESIKVEDAVMTEEQDKVFSYIYQSVDNDIDGDYKAVIKITIGDYTSISYKMFTLIDVQP